MLWSFVFGGIHVWVSYCLGAVGFWFLFLGNLGGVCGGIVICVIVICVTLFFGFCGRVCPGHLLHFLIGYGGCLICLVDLPALCTIYALAVCCIVLAYCPLLVRVFFVSLLVMSSVASLAFVGFPLIVNLVSSNWFGCPVRIVTLFLACISFIFFPLFPYYMASYPWWYLQLCAYVFWDWVFAVSESWCWVYISWGSWVIWGSVD